MAVLKRVKEAAGILRSGGIVVYPTETVYGIGCDPLDSEACRRVYSLKKRTHSKPFILLADSMKTVEDFAGIPDGVAKKLAAKFWPGPLTLIIEPSQPLPAHLFGPSGGVAFRVTPGAVAAALSREFGMPVVSTSANISGSKPAVTYDEAFAAFGSFTDCVLENTEKPDGLPSTVIDLTSAEPAILRTGAIGEQCIREVL